MLLRLIRVDVAAEGLRHAPPGPAVYAANHASALDILIVFGHLPLDFRIVYKHSLSLVPFLGWAIRLGGHLPSDRSHPFRARRSLDAAARRIRAGTSVVVFPEGTRSSDGSVRRFKRGSFALAIEAGVPVVPVSLVGVKAVVPHGLPSVRPGAVRVALHAPVPVAGRRAEARQLRDRLLAVARVELLEEFLRAFSQSSGACIHVNVPYGSNAHHTLEAVFKALALDRSEGFLWKQAEVRSDGAGRPSLLLHGRLRELAEGRGVRAVHVALSHTDTMATASVVLEA